MRNTVRMAVAAVVLVPAGAAVALDIDGVLTAALDQPRINVVVRRSATGAPLTATDIFGFEVFNVQAFYDSGASGILLSNITADALGIVRETFAGSDVIFEDVGVGGADQFNVSEQLYFSLANFHPNTDVENIANVDIFYTHTTGPVRAQVGPLPADPFPLLGGLDVFGMPTIDGKVVVMDPTPVNAFAQSGDIFDADTMRTYVYDPGTPFNPATRDTDPGVPATSRTIRLSRANFDRFTRVLPAGAPGPDLADNPFIGPDPVALLEGDTSDTTPGVRITRGGLASEGSWLFDMGAVATIISRDQAAAVGVTYSTDPAHEYASADPQLVGVSLAEQFALTLSGIGGSIKIAGFLLDSVLVRAVEGDAANDDDPNHIRFLNAPVLVADITVKDPITLDELTLDGIFGMNMLIAGTNFDEGPPLSIFDVLAPSAFEWAVFDAQANTLGLQINPAIVPIPAGDFDLNGFVDANDIDLLAMNLGDPAFDLDADNDADTDDVDFMIHSILMTEYGDANLDRRVSIADFVAIQNNFNLPGGWANGDFNADGTVAIGDFATFQNHFGFDNSAAAAGSVPEPATLALLSVGGLLALRRKRAA